MINKKKSKQVRMDLWLLKPLPKNMKTKTKNINQQIIIKNNRKIKNNKIKSNGKFNTYHQPLSQKWIDW